MNRLLVLVFPLALAVGISACVKPPDAKKMAGKPIFSLLSPSQSGVTFANNLSEDSLINYFTYPYLYMGGGVAVGDVNNDGLPDLYFTGNQVENKLYLNKGNLQFEDITLQAKVGADDRWVTGVCMADVNADGWLDIYVSVSGKFATTKNLLFLNDGVLTDGVPSFTECAEARGIADAGYSTQGVFFDYDKDGDLDLYVANYPPTGFKTPNYTYQYLIQKKDPATSDKLYRNKGDGTFEDVTAAAGLLNFGLSLSASVGDFNQDGWEDLYISNDFATPDFLYLNNGDGTFRETLKESTQHTAFFGMGTDVADLNNDGLPDILQVDMTPEDNRRNKANMASMNIAGFWEIVHMGMHFQYMQNAVQLNQGITDDGLPHFSDIARITGMSSTDWSWAGLFADLDNDGWKDVFITNGTRRDINNKDYFNEIENAPYPVKKEFDNLTLTLNMPSEKIDNYAFRNRGDLTFEPVIDAWGLNFKGFSNGLAYADLDLDGDLDLIINNIDDVAVIFQNKTADLNLANSLRVQFQGSEKNPLGIGAQVVLKNKGALQHQHLTLSRGFQSSVEPVLHFGLGQETSVEEVIITWPDGKQQTLRDVSANQVLRIDYRDATVPSVSPWRKTQKERWMSEADAEIGIDFVHTENSFDDYAREILLPHTYSRNGPGLAVGDVDGDGWEDFYIGGASGSSGALYVQRKDGTFARMSSATWDADAEHEDMGAVFFDADGDGDLDLYVVSGGNEFEAGSYALQDRLYLNDGRGNFTKDAQALPVMLASGSRVKPCDYDNDGDIDLFVGGRIVPGAYPLPARSYLLRNDGLKNGKPVFVDVTETVAPDLFEAGLVTDAVWADFDQDGRTDLVVVGEWMPLTFLKNEGARFRNQTEAYGLEKSTGWWYSIAAADFDGDGDLDFVAGNLGLNYKYQASADESFDVYAYDYDKNGKLDIVLGYYHDGVQYPVRGRQCSSEQIPTIKYKFEDYNSFAAASLENIYTAQDLEAALHYQAWNFASSYIENQGNGKFVVRNLPNAAQLSCINGIVVEDLDGDGLLDLVVAGNMYGSEIETTRNDASYGQVLLGDGKGHFRAVPFSESGLFLKHDTKDLAKVMTPQGLLILAANNHDRMKAIRVHRTGKKVAARRASLP